MNSNNGFLLGFYLLVFNSFNHFSFFAFWSISSLFGIW